MFGEKTEEWSAKQGKSIPVIKSPKYEESRAKAIEVINSGKYSTLDESDFWILMNETKSGKMMYSGLIISHNGCLKINDSMETEKRFKPESVSLDKGGWDNSLVYTYVNAEQGLYEVGEVSTKNCKISYPYAMAFKRMFDRVVLKLSKLAYAGIYGEDEADEFKQTPDTIEAATKTEDSKPKESKPRQPEPVETPMFKCATCGKVLTPYKTASGKEISVRQHANKCMKMFNEVYCLDHIPQGNESADS